MPVRKLITIISENPNEEEVIFRRVDNQKIIPPTNIELLKRLPEIITCPSYMLNPSSMNLNIDFKEKTNGVILGKPYIDWRGNHYPVFYCRLND